MSDRHSVGVTSVEQGRKSLLTLFQEGVAVMIFFTLMFIASLVGILAVLVPIYLLSILLLP